MNTWGQHFWSPTGSRSSNSGKYIHKVLSIFFLVLCETFCSYITPYDARWCRAVWVCVVCSQDFVPLLEISLYILLSVMPLLALPAKKKKKRQRFCCCQHIGLAFCGDSFSHSHLCKREFWAESPGRRVCRNSSNSLSPLPSLSPRWTLKLHFIIEVDSSCVGMDTVRSQCHPQEDARAALFLFFFFSLLQN